MDKVRGRRSFYHHFSKMILSFGSPESSRVLDSCSIMGGGPQRKHKVFCGSTRARSSSSVILPPGEIPPNQLLKRPTHRFLHLLHWQSQNGTNLEIISAKGGEVCKCCAWARLTAEERREGWVDICALLRDAEIAGELVGEFPTRLDDGALETHTVAAHPPRQERLQYSRYTHGFCRRNQNPVSLDRP